MKMTFQKNLPKELYYRDCKKFDEAVFKEELGNTLNNEIHNYETFEKIFISTLDKHASLRKKVLRANQHPYMTKT